MDELRGQRVLVLGLGMSGRSAAAFCAARGARVVAADQRAEVEGLASLPPGIETRLGGALPDPAEFDLVVPSPGVPRERYASRARRVQGDIELAYRALSVPVVAVTGTNGKSTTVRLIEAMLRSSGLRARAGGNVGEPALDLVGAPLDIAVLEVSSFQLETVDTFRPAVAVLLNLAPDHLDRHGSFEAYVEAKTRLFARQTPEDTAVLNVDDPHVRALARGLAARVLAVSTARPVEVGAWFDAGSWVSRDADGEIVRIPFDGLQLRGAHDIENATAALMAAVAAGADPRRAVSALLGFEGLPHRAQLVGNVGGVDFVDDSKATNPSAAARSLAGRTTPVIWIAGGRDKGLDFGDLADVAARQAHAAFLIGEAAEKLAGVLAGRLPVECTGTLVEAVSRAAAVARPGDTVLLAPACASQDQFRDYAERGDAFAAAVAALPGGDARTGAGVGEGR